MQILSFVADILILLALGESIIRDLDSSWLFVSVAFVFLALRSFHPLPKLNSLVEMLTSSLIMFWLWTQADLIQYAKLSKEPFELDPTAILLSFVAQLSIACTTFRLESFVSIAAIPKRLLVLSLSIASVYAVFNLISTQPHVLLPIGECNLTYSATLVLLLLRIWTLKFSSSVMRGDNLIANSAIGLGTILLILSFFSAQQKLKDQPLPAKPADYRFAQQFVIPLLVSEDPIFMSHRGVDYSRLNAAFAETIKNRKFGRGGSTISMQLAKVLYLSQEKTVFRKFNQIILAYVIECHYTKDQILFAYLESVPFAQGVTGITAASNAFFHRIPSELSDSEALKLVLTVYDPVTYNPLATVVPNEVMIRSASIKARRSTYGEGISSSLNLGF